jgi:hypothetical protein
MNKIKLSHCLALFNTYKNIGKEGSLYTSNENSLLNHSKNQLGSWKY